MSEKIKVCTFNLRINTPKDGINQFINREGRILEVIKREMPDLIGFQEANDMMRDFLTDNLAADYTIIGCGRDSDCTGESTAVAVRRGRFAVVSVDNFWLSFTPDVPGSTFGGDQSKCPRVTTCVYLRLLGSGEYVRFCNTHLDHKGETARLLGVAAIMQYLTKFGDRFILTGDFNARPESNVISDLKALTHCGRQVREATETVPVTFHCFGNTEHFCKIDYIFTDAEPLPDEAYAVIEPPVDGVYVSDHHPVVAYIKL